MEVELETLNMKFQKKAFQLSPKNQIDTFRQYIHQQAAKFCNRKIEVPTKHSLFSGLSESHWKEFPS